MQDRWAWLLIWKKVRQDGKKRKTAAIFSEMNADEIEDVVYRCISIRALTCLLSVPQYVHIYTTMLPVGLVKVNGSHRSYERRKILSKPLLSEAFLEVSKGLRIFQGRKRRTGPDVSL